MSEYSFLPRNRFFEVIGGMNAENRADNKFSLINEIDMTQCINLRQEINGENKQKPSYTALVARAVALTLKTHPYANRITIEWPFFKRIIQLENVHITVAVERDTPGTEQAVYAGTIRDTDTISIGKLTDELQQLATAQGVHGERLNLLTSIIQRLPAPLARLIVKFPRLLPSLWIKHRGGSVMISSPAKYGVDMRVANWPWPIGFSFGLVKDRPFVSEGKVVVRPTMMLIMSFDRRLMGGAPAARFFKAVADKLESAESSLAEKSLALSNLKKNHLHPNDTTLAQEVAFIGV
jgi:pyruvate/2-oxoglutarate dehydrogenase complex dihydrolipoamide acyltransferase (E2) component